MADRGTVFVSPPNVPGAVGIDSLVPVMPGEGDGGTPVPTVGIIFPSGTA